MSMGISGLYKNTYGAKIKICRLCGKEFEREIHSRMVYCSAECKKAAKHAQKLESIRKIKNIEKAKAKTKPKTGPTVNEINEKALIEGLSYGQYVSKYGL